MPDTIGSYREVALVDTYVDSSGNSQVFDSVRITPSFGAFFYQTIDLGYPTVRTATQDNPQADGTFNQTQFFGDRSVAIALKILNNAFGTAPAQYNWDSSIQWNSATWWVRYLTAWVTASRRVFLYTKDDVGKTQWIPLVGASAPSVVSRDSANFRDILLTFTNPTGKVYSFDPTPQSTIDGRSLQRIRQSSINFLGRSYPHGFDVTYPLPPPPIAVRYKGTVSNGFIGRVHVLGGTATAPTITMTSPDGTTGSMSLSSSLSLPAGTIVDFDTNAKTVKSYPAATPDVVSDRDEYKAGPLTWPQLRPGFRLGQEPGINTVDFSLGSATGTAADDTYLEIIWNDADLM